MHLHGFGKSLLFHPVSDGQRRVHTLLRPEHEAVAEDFVFIFQKGDDLVRQKRHPPLVEPEGHASPGIRKKDFRGNFIVQRTFLCSADGIMPDRSGHLNSGDCFRKICIRDFYKAFAENSVLKKPRRILLRYPVYDGRRYDSLPGKRREHRLHLRDNVDQSLPRRDLIINKYDRTRMIDPLAEMLRTELLFRRVTVLLQKLRPRLHFRDFLTGRMDINAVLKAGTDTRPDRRRSLSKTDNEPCIRIFLCQPPSERMKHFQCTLRFDRQMLPL